MQPVPEQDSEQDHPNSATATLRGEMLFYRDQAQIVIDKIMEMLKAQNSRADMIAMMYKYSNEAKKMAIDCAAKLAPYESPRLEAIEVTKKSVTKFVIESPSLETDSQAWLANTKKELKLINKMRQEIVEEAQVINTEEKSNAINNNSG